MLYALLFLCLAAAFTIYHVAGLTALVKKLHEKLSEPAKPERPDPKYHLLVSELKEGVHYRCVLSDRLVCVKNIRLKHASTGHSSFADCAVYNAITGNYDRESYGDNDLYTTEINLAPRELKKRRDLMEKVQESRMNERRRRVQEVKERFDAEVEAAAAQDYAAPIEEGGIPGLMDFEIPEPPPPPPDRIIREGAAPVPPRSELPNR